MENIFNSIAPALLFVSSLLGFGIDPVHINSNVETNAAESVELGLSETSPKGERGGYAMPASGCSALDPDWGDGTHSTNLELATCLTTNPIITANPRIVRYGSQTVISWNPNGLSLCSISYNLLSLTGGLNPPTINANSPGSRIDVITSQETYSILCWKDGNPYYADVTVKVLPRIQET